MTKAEHIKKIREACVKVNPEIMELEFGCRVKLKQRGDDGIILQKAYGEWLYYNYDAKECFVRKFDEDEILGREIRLSDVLFLFSELKIMLMVDWEGQFREFGDSCSRIRDNKYMPEWNLLKDNLADQELPVILFISSLLPK